MPYELKLHPDSVCEAVTRIEAQFTRQRAGVLALRYSVFGAISHLQLPAQAAPERADELWKHTCFEAFVRAGPGRGYYEFNFSPSTQWAAYRFSDYRTGMSIAKDVSAPSIAFRYDAECLTLEVALDAGGLELPGATWLLGLSAVIEEQGGRISYWALAHPPGKADFHHRDCFAISLDA